MTFLSAISSLIYPDNCFVCYSRDLGGLQINGICRNCAKGLEAQVFESHRGSLKIYSGSKYSPTLSHIILAAKESNRLLPRKFLAKSLARSLIVALADISIENNLRQKRIVIIPIPSRKAADRARGFAHIELLLRELKLELQRESSNISFEILNCLLHQKTITDQSSLNFHEREMNMRGAFKIKNSDTHRIRALSNTNPAIFLVDDLVTSGSTVQAANRALNHLGIRVDGVLTSCVTTGSTH